MRTWDQSFATVLFKLFVSMTVNNILALSSSVEIGLDHLTTLDSKERFCVVKKNDPPSRKTRLSQRDKARCVG